jgi:hypothetical protein
MIQRQMTVGTTSGEILNTNPRRSYLLFVNMSSNDIYLSFRTAATTNDIPLYGKGSYFELDEKTFAATAEGKYEMDLYNKIHAIASVAGSGLQVFEVG